jgi:hypothetical protein
MMPRVLPRLLLGAIAVALVAGFLAVRDRDDEPTSGPVALVDHAGDVADLAVDVRRVDVPGPGARIRRAVLTVAGRPRDAVYEVWVWPEGHCDRGPSVVRALLKPDGAPAPRTDHRPTPPVEVGPHTVGLDVTLPRDAEIAAVLAIATRGKRSDEASFGVGALAEATGCTQEQLNVIR